jgi:hypothetical protein
MVELAVLAIFSVTKKWRIGDTEREQHSRKPAVLRTIRAGDDFTRKWFFK